MIEWDSGGIWYPVAKTPDDFGFDCDCISLAKYYPPSVQVGWDFAPKYNNQLTRVWNAIRYLAFVPLVARAWLGTEALRRCTY